MPYSVDPEYQKQEENKINQILAFMKMANKYSSEHSILHDLDDKEAKLLIRQIKNAIEALMF